MDPFVLCSTFNEDAANYDRWRPRYVPELFAAVLRYAGAPGKALEIGMGTGQATEPFLQAGWQVTGVERGERLAAFAREKFRHQPQLQVVQGDFLTCPLEGPFDLFYAATAFHWLPEDRAFPRVKELLRPGGAVALFWNHPSRSARERLLLRPYRPCTKPTKVRRRKPTGASPSRAGRRKRPFCAGGDLHRWKATSSTGCVSCPLRAMWG